MNRAERVLTYTLGSIILIGSTFCMSKYNKPKEPERNCAIQQAINLIDITTRILAEPYKSRAQARANELRTQPTYDRETRKSFNNEPTMDRQAYLQQP